MFLASRTVLLAAALHRLADAITCKCTEQEATAAYEEGILGLMSSPPASLPCSAGACSLATSDLNAEMQTAGALAACMRTSIDGQLLIQHCAVVGGRAALKCSRDSKENGSTWETCYCDSSDNCEIQSGPGSGPGSGAFSPVSSAISVGLVILTLYALS